MKKSVKILVCAAVLAVTAVSCLLVFTAGATEIPTISLPKVLWKENFERFQAGDVWERQSIYLLDADGVIVDDASVIGGKKSLSVTADANSWGAMYVKYGTVTMNNGSFRVSMRLRTKFVDAVNVEVRNNYGGDAASFYSEYGFAVSNDAEGNPTAIYNRAGNLGNIQVANASHVLGADGVVDLAFDFSATENNALIFVCFHTLQQSGTLVFDDFEVTDLHAPATEMKIAYQTDFDSANTATSVFLETPFWCNSGKLEWNYESPFGGNAVSYVGNYYMQNGDNVYLGGLTSAELTTSANTLYYYSYNLHLTDVQELVLTSLDNFGSGQVYSELKYLNGEWSVVAAGGIRDFNAEYLSDGCWKISYFRETSSFGKDEFRIFATSVYSKTSVITIDNFTVAYAD